MKPWLVIPFSIISMSATAAVVNNDNSRYSTDNPSQQRMQQHMQTEQAQQQQRLNQELESQNQKLQKQRRDQQIRTEQRVQENQRSQQNNEETLPGP